MYNVATGPQYGVVTTHQHSIILFQPSHHSALFHQSSGTNRIFHRSDATAMYTVHPIPSVL